MIGVPKVNLGEDGRVTQAFYKVINARNGVTVFLSNSIKLPVVDNHMEGFVLLFSEEDWRTGRRLGRTNGTCSKMFSNKFFKYAPLGFRQCIDRTITWRGVLFKFYSMVKGTC